MERKIEIEELKSIQLEILCYVDEICKKNNINYSICGGTLLGAIRHGGYIPWDDDIDIMLRRKDYNELIKVLGEQKSNYSIYSVDNNDNYVYPYAKVADNRTVLYEPGINGTIGVNIDVFPIDRIDVELCRINKVLRRENLLKKMFVMKSIKWDNKRALKKNLYMTISQMLLSLFSRKSIAKRINKVAISVSGANNSKSGCLVWGYGSKEILPTSVFEKYKSIVFEGVELMAIADTNTYLRSLYGNYLQLPPEDKRVSHHGFKAYWKE